VVRCADAVCWKGGEQRAQAGTWPNQHRAMLAALGSPPRFQLPLPRSRRLCLRYGCHVSSRAWVARGRGWRDSRLCLPIRAATFPA